MKKSNEKVQNPNIKEMKRNIKNWNKYFSLRQMEAMARITHGSISKFLKTSRGLSQAQYKKIYDECIKSLYIQHLKAEVQIAKKPQPKKVKVYEYRAMPWYAKIWLIIKEIFGKVLLRKKQKK